LEEEHDNIRAALKWSLEQGEVEAALRIAGVVWKLWQIHGHMEEGVEWMKTILSRSRGHISEARAKALWGAADSLRHVSGVTWHPGFHSYYTEGRFASLKAKLGETRWDQLWAEGRDMGLSEIGACALEI
jgi:hypothetical protein